MTNENRTNHPNPPETDSTPPLLETIQTILRSRPPSFELCHTDAVKKAKILFHYLDTTRIEIKLLQLNGHSMVVVEDRAAGETIFVNAGYPPPVLAERYFVLRHGETHDVLRNPKVPQLESVALHSLEEIQAATAWGLLGAENNSFYPSKDDL